MLSFTDPRLRLRRKGSASGAKASDITVSKLAKDAEHIKKSGEAVAQSAQELDRSIETPEQKKKRIQTIEKELVRLSKNIKSSVERDRLVREIHAAAKKEDFREVADKMKKTKDINRSPKLQEKIDEIVIKQDKYGALASKIKSLKSLKSKLPAFMATSTAAGASVQELIDEYYVYDSNLGKWRAKTANELALEAAGEEDNIFSKAWVFLKTYFFGSAITRQTSRVEGAVNTGKRVEQQGKDLKEDYGEVYEKGVELGKDAKELAVETHRGIKYASSELRENPEALAAANAGISKMKGKINTKLDDVARQVVNNKDPKKAIEAAKGTYQSVLKEVKEGTPTLKRRVAQEAAKKRMPGFGFKTAGKFAVLSVLSVAIREAIMEKDPSKFVDNISNSSLWMEAIPFVGSYKSISRVFKDNGDPAWAKALDVGINVVGDAFLVAGIVGSFFTFGATGVAGVGAKTAIVTAGRGLLKLGTRQGAKQAIKATGKAAAGAFLKKKVTQKVIQEAGETLVEQTIKQGTKTTVKKVPLDQARKTWSGKVVKEFTEKSLIKQSIGTVGKYAAGMALLEEALNRLFPVEKIKDMTIEYAMDAVNQEVDKYVSPGMRELYQTVSGEELNIGTSSKS